MKNKKYSITFGIALICAVLFTACGNIVNSPEPHTPVESGYGRISISLMEEETAPQTARTIFPSKVFDKYVYTFTKAGETTGAEETPDNDGFFILEIGDYTVEVQAFIGDEEPYTLVATGVSAEFNVSPGNNEPVEVILTLADIEMQLGEFSYTITYPAEASAEIALLQWSALNDSFEDITLAPNDLAEDEGNGITEALPLEAGSYLLTVLIKKDDLYAGINDVIHISPSLSTVYTKNFNNEDLLINIPPIVNDYDISGIGLFIYNGDAKTVNVTRKANSSAGVVTIFYDGEITPPVDAGTYTVTFDVEAAPGWSAAEGLPAGTLTIKHPTPVADDYDVSGIGAFPYNGAAKTVSITPKENASTGTVTVFYNGSKAEPVDAGTYTVTFNVAASQGFDAAIGLPAGTLVITTTSATGIQMVWIPGGTFTMGSNNSIDWHASPPHQVTLSGFHMGIYQVTQEQYQAVMGNNPSYFHGRSGREPASREVQEKRPVEWVSWYDAIVFCNRLSIAEDLTPAYSISDSTDPDDWGTVPTSSNAIWNAVEIVAGSTGYRLPTEAQWEYACRAGTTTAYSWGDTTSAATIGLYAWGNNNSSSRTHEVGLKLPNAWGLYDMHGNVWEWCWDWYGSYTSEAKTDPTGPSSGSYCIGRGGSWYYGGQYLRSANRSYFDPTFRSDYYYPYIRGNNIGFRLVRP